MRFQKKVIYTYDVDNEAEAEDIIKGYKEDQAAEGYTVTKSKIDYKTKKDRKTGEILEENWVTEVTLTYDT